LRQGSGPYADFEKEIDVHGYYQPALEQEQDRGQKISQPTRTLEDISLSL